MAGMSPKTMAKARKVVKAAKAGNPRAVKKVAKASVTQAAKKGALVETTFKRLDDIAVKKATSGGDVWSNHNYGPAESRARAVSGKIGRAPGYISESESNQTKRNERNASKAIASKKATNAKLKPGAIKRAANKGKKQATKIVKKMDKANTATDRTKAAASKRI